MPHRLARPGDGRQGGPVDLGIDAGGGQAALPQRWPTSSGGRRRAASRSPTVWRSRWAPIGGRPGSDAGPAHHPRHGPVGQAPMRGKDAGEHRGAGTARPAIAQPAGDRLADIFRQRQPVVPARPCRAR